MFPYYFQLMYRMFGHVSTHDHNTTYPTDKTLVETSVLAIDETENKILINGPSGVGQEEELSYIVYGMGAVLKLRNWSELSVAYKDSTFEILTSFESVKTFMEECVVVIKNEDAPFVPLSEVLELQKFIGAFFSISRIGEITYIAFCYYSVYHLKKN